MLHVTLQPREADMSRNIGGYLTKAGTVDMGGWELGRVMTDPPRDVPGYRDIQGFYCDEDGIGDTMTPIVVRLTHGRMVPGWTMGEGMATRVDLEDVYLDEDKAWAAAFALAERDAEAERDYQVSLCRECFDAPKRGEGEHPELCASCYMEAPSRTLALHATT